MTGAISADMPPAYSSVAQRSHRCSRSRWVSAYRDNAPCRWSSSKAGPRSPSYLRRASGLSRAIRSISKPSRAPSRGRRGCPAGASRGRGSGPAVHGIPGRKRENRPCCCMKTPVRSTGFRLARGHALWHPPNGRSVPTTASRCGAAEVESQVLGSRYLLGAVVVLSRYHLDSPKLSACAWWGPPAYNLAPDAASEAKAFPSLP